MVSRVGVSDDFRKQVLGYGLTTAQILYRMPDHPSLLQTYVWQNYDLFPKFPALKDFLAFWEEKLEGPLFSVNPIALRQRLAYLWTNKRTVTELKTERFGTVICMEIGATCVGTIQQTYNPRHPVEKGEEKGKDK